MGRIIPPPDWQAILFESSGRLHRIQTEEPEEWKHLQAAADERGRYLHWTKFRHLDPMPTGLTHEEAWALVRMSRHAVAQPLPFRAKSQAHVVVCLTQPLLAAVRRVEGHRDLRAAGLPERPTTHERKDLRSFGLDALIDEAYYSAVIEGAVTTRQEARKMIREDIAPRDRSDWMILNNFQAGAHLERWTQEPMTPARLCEIQQILTANTLEDEADAGRIRTDDRVHIADPMTGEVVHVPPPARELPERLRALCDFANRDDPEDPLSPLVQACLLHYQLAYDHPFGDGNGRTARWLFLWRLLRCPQFWWVAMLSVSRVTNHQRQAYYDAFRHAETDGHDATYLVRHQIQALEEEMSRFARFLEERQGLGAYLRLRLRLPSPLNPRQLALAAWFQGHPRGVVTQQVHASHHDVSQPTARKDLESLVAVGLMERKEGRPVEYRASRRLREALNSAPLDSVRN
jgi:Fic family protein